MKKLSLLSTIFILVIFVLVFTTFITATTNPPEKTPKAAEAEANLKTALFAGGCFWCMEKPFEKIDGVSSVVSGYSGGSTTNPTYQDYGSGGHIEVVQISYDPDKVTYEKLLDTFWRQIDPTDSGGQFVDRGYEYSSAIFYYGTSQESLAKESKDNLVKSKIFNKPIVTPILPAKKFWPAEEYHQDYYKKNPIRYTFYRSGSGRDTFIKKYWKTNTEPIIAGKGNDLKERLTPLQYKVTQEDGTEPPFNNLYWDNKEAGIYVDIVSGEPLFSSIDKYDSKTGWPSFSKPLVEENIVEKSDMTWLMVRTEVRSKKADSHLGHVFDDGPAPSGLRYCINSASLRFIPAAELEQEGYGQFVHLF